MCDAFLENLANLKEEDIENEPSVSEITAIGSSLAEKMTYVDGNAFLALVKLDSREELIKAKEWLIKSIGLDASLEMTGDSDTEDMMIVYRGVSHPLIAKTMMYIFLGAPHTALAYLEEILEDEKILANVLKSSAKNVNYRLG